MKNGGATKASLKERAKTETKEFLIITIYLYICFSALIYFKAAILHAQGVPFAPFGIAVVKALLCAKFVLIGRTIHLGDRFKELPLIWPTLHRSVVFVVFLTVLNALEEIVVALIHHRTMADAFANIDGGTLQQIIAVSVVGMLVFFPFFAFQSLGELLGERNLVRVFIRPRHAAAATRH
jgi:hypothetical protein